MSGFTILLVEDNPGDAFLIKELLRQVEIPVGELITHTHLLPALADVDEKEIDLILLDLTLPDSQGLTTVSTMCERANGLPVVVLTGLEDDELGFKAIALGVQDYMSKNDLSKNSLNRTLRYALERYALSIEREKLIRELDAFSHTVAHDLKGPLGILMGHASMMQEYGEMLPASERKVSVDTIVNYCQKMNNIIDELMLLAHVRDKDVQSVPISMERTVQDAIIRLQPMIDEYAGRIERVGSCPVVWGTNRGWKRYGLIFSAMP
jgi:DNA-binding NarL/FixJ family response regulator